MSANHRPLNTTWDYRNKMQNLDINKKPEKTLGTSQFIFQNKKAYPNFKWLSNSLKIYIIFSYHSDTDSIIKLMH